ncbi:MULTISPECIES: S9 family peptidase [unclassified Phycicoccus]|uniref:S9 family peptidase n=1 Tax=unclassified Phycicoccus TaxID=2637926 RepID=UPI0007032B6C|nr:MULTISPECIES: S9 family peptidase [unclassified Phycicoccus]KQU70399.1 protease 2 [Phycicoccus sp. Root101]KQZ88691.1 protease 2 [Phycicoccus sp. Root563]
MSTPAVTPPSVPRPEQRPTTREHHGDVVIDPYEWLRDKSDPAVVAHLEDENAYAEAMTAGLQPLRDEIFEEIRSRTQETDLSVPVASGPWWYYSRSYEGSQYSLECRAPRADGAPRPEPEVGATVEGEQVLLDGNLEAMGHEFFSLGALSISPDHRWLAYAVDTEGDERFALRVKDLSTGEIVDTAVQEVGYGCVFSYDGRYLFYTRVDETWRPHQAWRHEVGTPAEDDVLVHEEPDERFWMGLGSSRDDRWIMVGLGSKTTSEVRLLDATDPLGEFRVVAPRREGVEYDVEPAADRLLIVHNADSIDSDLAWAPLDATSADQWQPLLRSAAGERFQGVEAFDDVAVLALRKEGLTAVRVLERDAGSPTGYGASHDLDFDEPVYSVGLGDNPESATTSLQVVFESLVTPRTVLDYDLRTRDYTLLKRQPVLGGYDPSQYEQRREWATAPDGTRVPISLVYPAGSEPDGTRPGLLTAYGSYEISSDPYFSVARLSLLERGFVYAIAHVRGGGELGRAWYDEGKLTQKRSTFTDFVACADHLVETGWVHPERLAAEGGSAGGLLIGAAVNLAPERFRVVHAAVPFVDALTTILDPSLPLTVVEWEEWGNPLADPEVYAYMKSYSPYENVHRAPYPAVLATTSLNDTRVYFTEPAKWVARLRENTTNGPDERPVLLRTEMVAGHGGKSGRYDSWRQVAWEWAFLVDQVGAGAQKETVPASS